MAEKNSSSDSGYESDEPTPVTAREKRFSLSQFLPFLRSRQNTSLRADLTDALATVEHPENASFSPQERLMLHNILRLGEARVEDIMIPRSEIEALGLETSLGDVLKCFEKTGHSRMPVYAETLDDPRGMVHIRDVLNYLTRAARLCETVDGTFNFGGIDLERSLQDLNLVRNVLFVPGSMMASQLLTRMQTTRTQMALVIDEYGGTDGLVSLEDIVELVVGDIEDEHDDVANFIVSESAQKWLLDARADLEEVSEALGPKFIVGELGEEVDTIGGFLVSLLDRIPSKGEMIEAVPGFRFRILEADKRRIKRIRVFSDAEVSAQGKIENS